MVSGFFFAQPHAATAAVLFDELDARRFQGAPHLLDIAETGVATAFKAVDQHRLRQFKQEED